MMMMMKMIPALNLVQIPNLIIREVMINLTVTYQLVHFLLVIYQSRSIEGDAAEVEVEADQSVHHHRVADRGADQGAVQVADQHVLIHGPHQEVLDLSKF